jgi:cell division protein FtsB
MIDQLQGLYDNHNRLKLSYHKLQEKNQQLVTKVKKLEAENHALQRV